MCFLFSWPSAWLILVRRGPCPRQPSRRSPSSSGRKQNPFGKWAMCVINEPIAAASYCPEHGGAENRGWNFLSYGNRYDCVLFFLRGLGLPARANQPDMRCGTRCQNRGSPIKGPLTLIFGWRWFRGLASLGCKMKIGRKMTLVEISGCDGNRYRDQSSQSFGDYSIACI